MHTLTRRRLLGATGGAGLSAAMMSCGPGGGGSTTQDESLRLFTYAGDDEYERLREALREYSNDNDLEVTPENLPGSGAALYPDKLRTQLAGGQPPDIFRNWGGQLARPFIDSDLTAQLDSYYEEYDWESQLITGAIEDVSVDGAKFGVPIKVTALGFWHRQDLFEQAGLEGPPESYEELEEYCAELRGAGVVPIATGGRYGWHPMRLFEYLLEVVAGPELHDELMALETSWDTAEVAEAFRLFQRFVEQEWLNDGFMSMTPDDAQTLVMQGGAAMITEVSSFEQQIVDAGQTSQEWGTFIPPTGHDPLRFSGFIEQYMIAEAAGNAEAAAELINWLIQAETIEQMQLPSPATIEAQPDESEAPLEASWSAWLEEYEHYLILDQAFDKELADGYFEVQSAVAQGQHSPEDAAAEMQSAIEQWQD